MELIHSHSLMDGFFRQWKPQLGEDYDRYRNHCYRVVNHCNQLTPLSRDQLQQVMIAACFHDIGIWLDNTFDYLEPSHDRANNYLVREGKNRWKETVCSMIMEHHKITEFRGNEQVLVNAFRKADWVDVSMGVLNFAIPRKNISAIRQEFPYLGFHSRLIELAARNLKRHPFNPLPMLKI